MLYTSREGYIKDLIQYTLAADRMNERISYLYEPLHPAVLHLIKAVIDAAHRGGKWVGMCGEMAGDVSAAAILLGLGLDELSMSASSLCQVKEAIRSLTLDEAQQLAREALELDSPEAIRALAERHRYRHTECILLPRAGLGVLGAAAATAAATAFSGICMMVILFRRKTPFQIHLTDRFVPQIGIIRQAARLGIPVALERMTISMGQIVSTAMITGLGTMSLAAHQLASTGESLCYLPAYGFGMAGTTLVAQYLGTGDRKRAYCSGQWAIRQAAFVMLITSAAMFYFASPIIDLFSNNRYVIQLGALMLRIEAFAEPLLAVGVVMAGIFHGAGDNRWPFYISIVGMWIVRLPTAYIMIKYFHGGLASIWVAMIVDWLVRALLSSFRFYRKRWMSAWK